MVDEGSLALLKGPLQHVVTIVGNRVQGLEFRVQGLGFRADELVSIQDGIDQSKFACPRHTKLRAKAFEGLSGARPRLHIVWVAVKELKLSYHNGYI